MNAFWIRSALLLGLILGTALTANALSKRPLPLGSGQGPGQPVRRSPRLSIDQLGRDLSSGSVVVLLDVRRDVRDGRPARSIHIPAESFPVRYVSDRLAGPLKAASFIVVICEGGACSAADRVARLLQSLGHREVRVLQGGWLAYQKSGLPVEVP